MEPLARAVVTAGHEVAFATGAEYGTRIEQAGYRVFPAGMSLPDQLAEAAQRYPDAAGLPPSKERFELFVPQMLAGVAAPARVAELVGIIRDWQPDLVVHDETEFAAAIAAELCGVPYADHSVGICRPMTMARLAGVTQRPLAEEWGVDVGEFGGLFRYLYLDVCPPSLQSSAMNEVAEVAEVAYPMTNLAVPAGSDEDKGLPGWIRSLPPVPTVYVSLGTIFNHDPGVFIAILEGLRDEPVNVVATVGNDNDPAVLGPQPANVHVERYIPQALLLPHCQLVVNQGGTAMLDILGHGLPLLVVPQGANQFHNAEACVRSGAGLALLPAEVEAPRVAEGLRRLVKEDSFRVAAGRIAEEIKAMPTPEAGVALLERLAEQRRRLTRTDEL